MSKWHGMVGFGITDETRPGVWEIPLIIERPYYGEMTRVYSASRQGDGPNDDVQLKNDISIVADAYAHQNFASMRYITIMGVRWKVESVEVERPRLRLSIGGVYNGPTPETPEPPGDGSGDQESILSTSL